MSQNGKAIWLVTGWISPIWMNGSFSTPLPFLQRATATWRSDAITVPAKGNRHMAIGRQ